MKKLLVCVGYDSREDIAYEVCRHSVYRRSTLPVEIYPLKHKELRDRGIFWRPWLTAGSGQTVDCIDGRPFSTAFSHTRFLTPHIAKEKGYEWALFVDCDFLFTKDVAKLFSLVDDKYSVMCRKFANTLSTNDKMDGMKQTAYEKKLWSSLCLWNTKASFPSVQQVNSKDGAWLHQFKWLGEDRIPKAIHFTEGGPWLPEYARCEYGHLWKSELEHMENSK